MSASSTGTWATSSAAEGTLFKTMNGRTLGAGLVSCAC
jgi:hypothetical protein